MTPNHNSTTLLQLLHSQGSISVADLHIEYQRIQQLRKAQGQRINAMSQPPRIAPSMGKSLALRLLSNADKVIALATGLTAGVRMMKRIKRLF